MNSYSRRTVLRGVGHAAAFGSLATALPHQLMAAQAAAAPARASICLSTLYQSGEGVSFDANRFRDQHLALLKSSYGTSVERIELRVSDPPAEGAPAPRFLAVTNVWISDIAGFVGKVNTHAKTVSADLTLVTNCAPMAQVNQVMASLGEAREAVPADSECFSILFPSKEGGTWDAKYYFETYVPKFYEIMGATAVRRIEAVQGAPGSDGKDPAFKGAIHFYIKDSAAYDEAAKNEAFAALNTEAATHSNLQNLTMFTRVHAAG